MDNIIKFKTAARPLIETNSKFPYDDMINSLKALAADLSIVCEVKECSSYHVHTLRKYLHEKKIGHLCTCKKDNKVYLWLRK